MNIPDGVEVCDVSFGALLTSGWDYKIVNIDNEAGYLLVTMANSSGALIPVGTTHLFDVIYAVPSIIGVPEQIRWDTTLSGDPSRRTLFVDTTFNTLVPRFDYLRDAASLSIPGEPGDFDGVSGIDVGDLTFMIAYLYLNGPAPCDPVFMELNGDCEGPDIGDLSYFIAHLYLDGEPPRGCTSAEMRQPAIRSSDILVSSSYANGSTVLTITSAEELTGVEFSLRGPVAAGAANMTDGLGLFSGVNERGLVQVALIDPEGANRLTSGTTQLVRLAGEFEIVSSRVAHIDHSVSYPRISDHPGASLPSEFTLEQNYPNPFNPDTRIRFSLPVPSHAKLTVYNVLGRHVSTLADGYFEAGTHTVTWNAAGISSGVYFYRVETDRNTASRKMLLLK
jgi:hypothetical protein